MAMNRRAAYVYAERSHSDGESIFRVHILRGAICEEVCGPRQLGTFVAMSSHGCARPFRTSCVAYGWTE